MKNLTHLSAKKNRISDVTSLKSLVNLRALFLSDNKITDISSLSSLKKLGTDGASFSILRNPLINKTCPFDDKYVCGF
jgi:internalin A